MPRTWRNASTVQSPSFSLTWSDPQPNDSSPQMLSLPAEVSQSPTL